MWIPDGMQFIEVQLTVWAFVSFSIENKTLTHFPWFPVLNRILDFSIICHTFEQLMWTFILVFVMGIVGPFRF